MTWTDSRFGNAPKIRTSLKKKPSIKCWPKVTKCDEWVRVLESEEILSINPSFGWQTPINKLLKYVQSARDWPELELQCFIEIRR